MNTHKALRLKIEAKRITLRRLTWRFTTWHPTQCLCLRGHGFRGAILFYGEE